MKQDEERPPVTRMSVDGEVTDDSSSSPGIVVASSTGASLPPPLHDDDDDVDVTHRSYRNKDVSSSFVTEDLSSRSWHCVRFRRRRCCCEEVGGVRPTMVVSDSLLLSFSSSSFGRPPQEYRCRWDRTIDDARIRKSSRRRRCGRSFS